MGVGTADKCCMHTHKHAHTSSLFSTCCTRESANAMSARSEDAAVPPTKHTHAHLLCKRVRKCTERTQRGRCCVAHQQPSQQQLLYGQGRISHTQACWAGAPVYTAVDNPLRIKGRCTHFGEVPACHKACTNVSDPCVYMQACKNQSCMCVCVCVCVCRSSGTGKSAAFRVLWLQSQSPSVPQSQNPKVRAHANHSH